MRTRRVRTGINQFKDPFVARTMYVHSSVLYCVRKRMNPFEGEARIRTRRVRTGINQSWTTQKSCARTVLKAGRVVSSEELRSRTYR